MTPLIFGYKTQSYLSHQQYQLLLLKDMDQSLYSHLSNGMHQMRMEHLEGVRDVLTQQFINNNNIWSSAKLTRDQLKKFFTDSIIDHLQSQQYIRKTVLPNAVYNFIAVSNGKLSGCLMHYEVSQYRKKQTEVKAYEAQIYNELEREGRELAKCVDLHSYEKGKYIFCSWIARIQLAEYNQIRKVKEVAQSYESMRLQGFKGMICRSSNIKVIRILEPIGGQLLKESVINTNGKSFSLYFAMLDLQNQKLKDFIQMTKMLKEDEITAKL